MSMVGQVPKGMAEKKAPHGEPCTRCGACCAVTLCPLGVSVFRGNRDPWGDRGVEGPCPALSFNAEGSVCGLVDDPMRFAMARTLNNGVEVMKEAARHLIGSNFGCDARFNGEPPNVAFYEKQREFDRRNESKTRRSAKLWGLNR